MLTSTPLWHTGPDQPPANCTATQWEWLTSIDPLTARLRRLSGNKTHIQLHSAAWGETYPEEKECILAAAQPWDVRAKTWVREITHLHQQQPWVWARAVMPEHTLQITGLDGATSQSLGDILSQDPQLRRTGLALALLPSGHPYHRSAAPYLQNTAQSLWARRSILWFKQQPLLVAEIFLPDFFAYANLE